MEKRRAEAKEADASKSLVMSTYVADYIERRRTERKPLILQHERILSRDVAGLMPDVRIDRITTADIDAFLKELALRSISARTWGLIYLKVILNDAKRRGTIVASPADAYTVPDKVVRERVLRTSEVQRILEACRDNGTTHGIVYSYEREYEHPTATLDHGQYRPDFFFPDIDLYHEHFAIDDKGRSHFGRQYEEGVAWKRRLHAERETALVETTSHQIRRRQALPHLADVLAQRGQPLKYDRNRRSKGPPPIGDRELAGLIRTFQQHVKGGGITIDQLRTAAAAETDDVDAARSEVFLWIYERIAAEWERQLTHGGCIDFDDMLRRCAMRPGSSFRPIHGRSRNQSRPRTIAKGYRSPHSRPKT